MDIASTMQLWCKREEDAFGFTIKVAKPQKINNDLWECEWCLGEIFPNKGRNIKNINSMVTLLTTIQFIGHYLKGREEQGDQFFLDEQLKEPVDSISDIFFYGCRDLK